MAYQEVRGEPYEKPVSGSISSGFLERHTMMLKRTKKEQINRREKTDDTKLSWTYNKLRRKVDAINPDAHVLTSSCRAPPQNGSHLRIRARNMFKFGMQKGRLIKGSVTNYFRADGPQNIKRPYKDRKKDEVVRVDPFRATNKVTAKEREDHGERIVVVYDPKTIAASEEVMGVSPRDRATEKMPSLDNCHSNCNTVATSDLIQVNDRGLEKLWKEDGDQNWDSFEDHSGT